MMTVLGTPRKRWHWPRRNCKGTIQHGWCCEPTRIRNVGNSETLLWYIAYTQDWLETGTWEQEWVSTHSEGSPGWAWGTSSLASGREMQQPRGTGCLSHWSRHGSKHPGPSLLWLGSLGLIEECNIICTGVHFISSCLHRPKLSHD